MLKHISNKIKCSFICPYSEFHGACQDWGLIVNLNLFINKSIYYIHDSKIELNIFAEIICFL